jgi:hypothetical protein
MGIRDIDPCVLKLGTKWRCVLSFSFMLQPLYSPCPWEIRWAPEPVCMLWREFSAPTRI